MLMNKDVASMFDRCGESTRLTDIPVVQQGGGWAEEDGVGDGDDVETVGIGRDGVGCGVVARWLGRRWLLDDGQRLIVADG
ncbi:hypothetical protein F0562_021524 [Nyssa sinensis]|uniref:Uncharacterized protein n=1 Tax=Nyssa sinensis TaxID=561372 RepID=A0A5J5BP83_9ASTE|nr:hypothetical protein F0562_021524 [Nyssa sinensis]